MTPDWNKLLNALQAHLDRFPRDGKLSPLRREIAEACRGFADHGPGVYRLNVPTGGGKTLSSMLYALTLAKHTGAEHIFYIAPYLTILEQNAKAIREAIDDAEAVLEHHSNLVVPEAGNRSAAGEDGDAHGAWEASRLLTERWDSPIIVTSVVQFMEALFSGRPSAARRMRALFNSVIIIDEVQSVPIKTLYLFNMAVNFLSRICNCTLVLCTATQPRLARLRYPLWLSQPADMIPDAQAREQFAAFKRTELRYLEKQGGYTSEQLAELALDQLAENGNLLAVMNTKHTAEALYLALSTRLPADTVLYYLSTNLCPQHRQQILKKIKEELGHKRLICVSTQLIEAGVDISFRCVIRALAGLDSLIQAAGRCNREGETGLRYVYVVDCAEEKLDRLPDIRLGAKISRRLFQEFAQNPEYYDHSLFSPRAVDKYYEYFFFDQEAQDHISYPVNGAYSALDLLGGNPAARKEYEKRAESAGLPARPYPLAQSFATAGRAFKVIEDDTLGIIVPYGKGGELTDALRSAASIEDKRRLLREVQRYAVNVYAYQLDGLSHTRAIQRLDELGVYVLERDHYHPQLGVSLSKVDNIEDYFR